MDRRLLIALIFFFLAQTAQALPFSPIAVSPGEQCRGAIASAERGHGVPPQLLAAIGRVESGRRDPVTGVWGAWPWTINAEGIGSYFDTKAEAIQAVQALQARGVRSIDVGCMQVNLMHHPTAFTTLDMAFEPAVNADYAARFLVQLHEQTGDWTTATADYHSSNPGEGGPYADRVNAIWPEEQRKAGLLPSMPVAAGQIGTFSPGAFGQVSRNAPPFPVRQPARLFAMAGTPPIMMPPTRMPIMTLQGGMMPQRGMMPQGGMMSQAGTPAGIMQTALGRSGMAQPNAAGFGQRTAPAGRGLDFYRAMPTRTDMAPRQVIRMPYGGSFR